MEHLVVGHFCTVVAGASFARFQPKLDAPYAFVRDTGKRNKCPTRVWYKASKLHDRDLVRASLALFDG